MMSINMFTFTSSVLSFVLMLMPKGSLQLESEANIFPFIQNRDERMDKCGQDYGSVDKCGQDYGSDNCPENFMKVGGVGCIHVSLSGSEQTIGRAYCQRLGGDLIVPDEFACLQQFINSSTTYTRTAYWVGIENKVWINGDPVLDEQTGRGLSNSGHMPCAYLHKTVDYFLLGYGCHYTIMPPICKADPQHTCKPKNKCSKKGGSCILKGEECEGKVTKHCKGQNGENCKCCLPPKGTCVPTPKCEDNEGYCIKKGDPCFGTVTKDCKGSKKCRCCIPTENCGEISDSDFCPENYFRVGRVGCIHISSSGGSQSEAKSYCQRMNGSLIIPEKFECLQKFIYNSDTYNDSPYYWVGVEDRLWLNGEPVRDEETGRGLSNSGALDCAYLHSAVDYFLLGYGCSYNMPQICMAD